MQRTKVVKKRGKILMSMMKRFIETVSEEIGFNGEINNEVMEEAQRRIDKERLSGDTLIPEVKWGPRVRRALSDINAAAAKGFGEPIVTLLDLSGRTEIEILVQRNFGPVSMNEIRLCLVNAGLPAMKREGTSEAFRKISPDIWRSYMLNRSMQNED